MPNTMLMRGMSNCLAVCLTAALACGLMLATGCGEGNFADAFVTIAPGNTLVGTGSSFFVIAEASPIGVTWSINGGSNCTGTACGTLTNPTSTSVTYVAPVSITGSTMNVTVTAVSNTDSKIQATEVLTVFPVYVVVTGPSNSSVVPLTSAQFSATVVNDQSGEGVTWSVSGTSCSGASSTPTGCGTLSNSSPTQTTFSAPPTSTAETIKVTATSIADPAENASFAVSVPKLAVYIFTPTLLPPAIANTAYSAKITIVGNTPPYTITPTNLPAWATATQSGNTVTIAGTPPPGTQGTYFAPVTVVDSSTPTALQGSQSFALTTYPSAATGNNLLKGSYAFFVTGWVDGTSTKTTLDAISYIGSFTADGNGNITAGEMDVNSPTTGLTSYSTLAGTYDVQYGAASTTQTGYITLIPPVPAAGAKQPLPITFAVTLAGVQNGGSTAATIASTGTLLEFDDSTGIGASLTVNSSGVRTTGPLALQSASAISSTSTPFTGSYVYGMQGNSAVSAVNVSCYELESCGPISLAGVISMGANGAITTGEEDVMVWVNNAPAVTPLTGSMGSSGNTDAYGRETATITTPANSVLTNWPSHYVIYDVSPQKFFIMSSDSYATNSLITGTALQQNSADIASTPFSPTLPIVLYENEASTSSISTNGGPTGQLKSNVQVYPIAVTSATAGTFSAGPQYQNASGTYTAVAVGGAGNYTYTVASNGRVAVNSTAEPTMYLSDTNTGFGTLSGQGLVPGLWTFVPQTATALNPGTYSYSTYDPSSQQAPMETGVVIIGGNGVPTGPSTAAVAVTGYDFTAFSSTGAVYVTGDPILYSGSLTGSMEENAPLTDGIAGIFGRASTNSIVLGPPGTPTASTDSHLQGCGQVPAAGGGGFVISATSFACVPAGSSFSSIKVFTQ